MASWSYMTGAHLSRVSALQHLYLDRATVSPSTLITTMTRWVYASESVYLKDPIVGGQLYASRHIWVLAKVMLRLLTVAWASQDEPISTVQLLEIKV